MRILLSLLLIGLFAGSRGSSQAKGQDPDQAWIERLKATRVARMEAGLPEKPFDQWLTERLKAGPPKYQLSDCEDEGSAKCILVTAETAPARKMELTFAIPQTALREAANCRFVSGVIGPSDPRSKQPTRLIRKLSGRSEEHTSELQSRVDISYAVFC